MLWLMTNAAHPDSKILISVDGCADETLRNWLWDLDMAFGSYEEIAPIRDAATGDVVLVTIGFATFAVEIINDGYVAEAAE